MAGEAELVLLGIQAAIRINAQYRKGFADSVRSNAITIPLPNFNPAADLSTALVFYTVGVGVEFATSNARVAVLTSKAGVSGPLSLVGSESGELLSLYRDHSALVHARNGDLVSTGAADNPAILSNRDAFHLLQIRQWREGQDPNPSMLRRLAGTFIEIGVDYFANYSHLAVANTAQSKALVGFLRAIEPISFAEGAPREIVEQLFVATIETIRDNAGLISQDQWAQTLIHDVTAGLYTDAKKLIDNAAGDLSRHDRITRWTQLIYRSVLKSAGDSVFTSPATFFTGLDAGQADLVGRVGRAILGAIITGNNKLDHLFTPDALDAIAKACFAAVSAHPELVAGGNDRLQKLVGAIAQGLSATPNLQSGNFLPQAIRIIIEKTGENLDVLMPANSDPAKNLLLVASKEVLAIISAPPQAAAKWKLQFGPAQLDTLLHAVVAEVAANPGWLVAGAGGANSVLGEVTQSVIDALRGKVASLLSPDTALAILIAAYGAVRQRLQLASRNPANQRLIGAALDAVFAAVFDSAVNAPAQWVLGRDEGVARLTSIVLEALARHGASDQLISVTVLQLRSAIQDLGLGKKWSFEEFSASLDAKLAAA